MKYTIFFLIFSLSVFADSSVIDCKSKMKSELMKSIQNDDKALIKKIYLITALRLTKKILDKKESGSTIEKNSIESYLHSLNLKNTDLDKIKKSITDLHKKYGPDKSLTTSQFLEMSSNLSSGNTRLTNSEISLLINMMKSKSSDKNQLSGIDEAITWYAGKVGDQYSMSRYINHFMDQNENLDIDKVNKKLAIASNELKYEFSRIKKKTYTDYADICIKDYDPTDTINTASNASVFFNYCQGDITDLILDQQIIKSFEDLTNSIKPILETPELSPTIDSNKQRFIQDLINNKSSNLEKVIAYYASPLYQGQCQNITIVNKETNELMLYDTKGVKQMSFPVILGRNNRGFNSDSYTRYIEDLRNSSTNSTGAGVFSFRQDEVNDKNKVNQKEFGGQLYSVNLDNGDESKLALHSIPMGQQEVGNYQERVNAFKGTNKSLNLSGGCLNMESYNYNIVKNHIGPNCPLVVLPSDKSNYFFVKNNRLNFSSSKASYRTNKDTFTKGGVSYSNIYNFTESNPIKRGIVTISTGKYNSEQALSVKDYILKNKAKIKLDNLTYLEQDSFQDIILLSIATSDESGEDPESIVKDMLNAYEYIKRNSKVQDLKYNYSLITRNQKLRKLLETYNKKRSQNAKKPLSLSNYTSMSTIQNNISIDYFEN
ncbi:MAG: hypothetical protein ACI9QD_000044 [Thermoproteota archaeon]|jgi:hypothetical protein